MDAAQALADLTEISSQVVQAAVLDEGGAVLASTFGDEGRARRFADGVRELVAGADSAAQTHGLASVSQLEAATPEGSVFVVRGAAGASIAAVTRPEPTVGLVFYDLKHCVASIEAAAKPRRKRADAPA